MAAAKAAQADQFICALPEQYDTLWVHGAPDSPADGSGLHWAHALLRDAPIVFLDEPPSAFATDTEAA